MGIRNVKFSKQNFPLTSKNKGLIREIWGVGENKKLSKLKSKLEMFTPQQFYCFSKNLKTDWYLTYIVGYLTSYMAICIYNSWLGNSNYF